MVIDILTLFPQMFTAPLGESIIGRAAARGLITIRCHQIRDYTLNRQNQVDDYPYGGGPGCVMTAQPIYDCWQHVRNLDDGTDADAKPTRTIYFSPRGKRFDQRDICRLAQDSGRLILICGHYEGVDQRVIDSVVDEELSLGDFVMTGGEIPAMALADAVCRMIPGVLSETACFTQESHFGGLLEHPQYTRPAVWNGQSVPAVLQTGDHIAIADWQKKKSFRETCTHRPDLFNMLLFTRRDRKLLGELRAETDDLTIKSALANLHTGRITVRKTGAADAKYNKFAPQPDETDFSIYAENQGYCGHCGYRMDGITAAFRIEILPHAKGKHIAECAAAYAMDCLFTETNATHCTAQKLPQDLAGRLGFVQGAAGDYNLIRTDWLAKRALHGDLPWR